MPGLSFLLEGKRFFEDLISSMDVKFIYILLLRLKAVHDDCFLEGQLGRRLHQPHNFVLLLPVDVAFPGVRLGDYLKNFFGRHIFGFEEGFGFGLRLVAEIFEVGGDSPAVRPKIPLVIRWQVISIHQIIIK